MKKILIVLAALAAVMMGSTPAMANSEASATPAVSQSATVERDTKMGALPLHYKICVANGIAGYNTKYVLEKWTQKSYGALDLVVLSSCTGYSITNRLTIDTYYDTVNGGCGKFTRLEKAWSPGQGKFIYNNNPVVWINMSPGCAGYNDTFMAHYVSEFTGYILGTEYIYGDDWHVMSHTSAGIAYVKYVTSGDLINMANVYGLTA